MNKLIFSILMIILMISSPAMALDTRDRPIALPSLPGLSAEGSGGCSNWSRPYNCQKDIPKCLEYCKQHCMDDGKTNLQRPLTRKIVGCSKDLSQ